MTFSYIAVAGLNANLKSGNVNFWKKMYWERFGEATQIKLLYDLYEKTQDPHFLSLIAVVSYFFVQLYLIYYCKYNNCNIVYILCL